jgi:formate C-acetyltransferase
LVEKAVEEKGKTLDPKVIEIFKYAKNHNAAVFDAYDEAIRKFRSNHLVT